MSITLEYNNKIKNKYYSNAQDVQKQTFYGIY